jgi:excinuclease ABC subunit B
VEEDTAAVIAQLQEEMVEASRALEFERAALLRDQINELKAMAAGSPLPKGSNRALKTTYTAKRAKKQARP